MRGFCLLLAFMATVAAPSLAAERSLLGKWCIDAEEGLIITFLEGDSVHIMSMAEDGVSGYGRYEKRDTMFVATIGDEELEIQMGYQYAWRTDTSLDARALFLTVNGDSLTTPEGDIRMIRCSPSTNDNPAKTLSEQTDNESAQQPETAKESD